MSEHLEGLGLVELLELLEPVPEPDPVSMMPQTMGWVWLGGALLVLVALAARTALRRYRANGYRRAALRELDRAGDDPARIAAVLRRAALAAFPRAEVAALTGPDWPGFLNATCPGLGLSAAAGDTLTASPYMRTATTDPGLARTARRWVRHHRRGD